MRVLELQFQLCVLTGRAERESKMYQFKLRTFVFQNKMVMVLKVFRKYLFSETPAGFERGRYLDEGSLAFFPGCSPNPG